MDDTRSNINTYWAISIVPEQPAATITTRFTDRRATNLIGPKKPSAPRTNKFPTA